MDPEEAAVYIAAEHLPDGLTSARHSQLHGWIWEATAVLTEPTHWELFRECGMAECQPDSRRIACRIGRTTDEVNIAFARLLRLGLVKTNAEGRWMIPSDVAILTEREFRRDALVRLRQKAAEARRSQCG